MRDNAALAQTAPTDPANLAEVYTDRGLAYFAVADLAHAIADFDDAVRLDHKNERAYFNRGCIRGQQGDYAAAIQDFTQVLTLNPHNGDALLDRGIAQYQMRKIQPALTDLRQAAHIFLTQDQRIAYTRAVNLMQQIQQTQLAATAWG
jgi:tetratricopeptide (TPR) repeat protein